MKKAWIIGTLFSLFITLSAKEVVGKYISYEQYAESVGVLVEIDGKVKEFEMMDFDVKILEKYKNKFGRIKYSNDGYESLENIYFNDGTTLKEEHQSNSFFTLDRNEKDCNNGDTQKCYELAQENAGFLEATGYYNKACEGGHAKACNELAQIYELGNRAVQKDVELAKKYYKLACKNGISDACEVNKEVDRRNKVSLKNQSIYTVSGGRIPRCDDNDVKNLTVDLALAANIKATREKLESSKHWLNVVFAKEKESGYKNKFRNDIKMSEAALQIFDSAVLRAIRTDSIDDRFQKSTCKAEIFMTSELGNIIWNVDYIAQMTSDGRLYVEITESKLQRQK